MLKPEDISSLQKEVQRLRMDGLSTRAISVHLAGAILNRYGERPTSSQLLELLRDRDEGKCPSFGTVQSALKQFWEKEGALRKHDQQILEGCSPDLRQQASDLFNSILTLARGDSEASFNTFRQKHEQKLLEARRDLEDRDRDLARAGATNNDLLNEVQQERQAREQAKHELAEVVGRYEETKKRLEALEEEKINFNLEIEWIREKSTRELQSLRESLEKKLQDEIAQSTRIKEDAQKEISHLDQLLTASDETIKRLRLDVQREVDRSEVMREKNNADQAEFKLTREEVVRLKEKVAGLEARVEARDSKISILLRRPIPVAKKRGRQHRTSKNGAKP
jgi:DNA repair exonuclease SbcCD ATPase subunit